MDYEQRAVGALIQGDIHLLSAVNALRSSSQVQWASTNAQRYLDLVGDLAGDVSGLEDDVNALRSLIVGFFAQLPNQCLAVVW